jgi:hypothetical protein|tara:strand:- start:92 stop:265 length:174 start_codon:yes stop_codon:yes gene_type:complete
MFAVDQACPRFDSHVEAPAISRRRRGQGAAAQVPIMAPVSNFETIIIDILNITSHIN